MPCWISAQLNIKVGYSLGFTQESIVSEIVDLFNQSVIQNERVMLDIPLKGIGTMHGINLGFRYRLSDVGAFELSWENLGSDSKALGEYPNGSLYEYDIFYSFNQYFLTYNTYFGNLGIGSGVGYNNVIIQERIAQSDNKRSFDIPNQWVARIHLDYSFGSSTSVGLSLQPYVQFPITKVNMNSLADRLGVDPLSSPDESFITFGLSLVFYNGPQ